MSRFRLIAAGVDVSGINAELDARPDLWNVDRVRTADPSSPHHGVPDIWLRWRNPKETAGYDQPHVPQFWPAWSAMPSLHPIVRNLAHVVNATQLGGILITSIPAGGEVKPHIDGGWHARHFDTKLYLTLRSNPLCLNWCEGECENFRAGDVWEFPNHVVHSVVNGGSTDRLTCIICFRTVEHELRAIG